MPLVHSLNRRSWLAFPLPMLLLLLSLSIESFRRHSCLFQCHCRCLLVFVSGHQAVPTSEWSDSHRGVSPLAGSSAVLTTCSSSDQLANLPNQQWMNLVLACVRHFFVVHLLYYQSFSFLSDDTFNLFSSPLLLPIGKAASRNLIFPTCQPVRIELLPWSADRASRIESAAFLNLHFFAALWIWDIAAASMIPCTKLSEKCLAQSHSCHPLSPFSSLSSGVMSWA